jgi:hypothetical protein
VVTTSVAVSAGAVLEALERMDTGMNVVGYLLVIGILGAPVFALLGYFILGVMRSTRELGNEVNHTEAASPGSPEPARVDDIGSKAA